MVALVLFGVSFAGVGILWYRSRKHRHEVVGARERMDLDVLFREAGFMQAGVNRQEFIRIWTLIANKYGIDPGQLRPADRFDNELYALEAWTTGEAALDIEDELKKSGLLRPAMHGEKVQSVADLVLLCCTGQPRKP